MIIDRDVITYSDILARVLLRSVISRPIASSGVGFTTGPIFGSYLENL